MSVSYKDNRPSGEMALERSSRLHKSIIGISVAVTAGFAFSLAKLRPGVSATSSSTAGLSAQANSTPSAGIAGSNSSVATLAPVTASPAAQAPVVATGGS